MTTESDQGSPLKSRAKISMAVPPPGGLGGEDGSKSKVSEGRGGGEGGDLVGRPMFEIPYSNKTRCVLPDSPKIWPKSRYKEHYGAYKQELGNREKLERKYHSKVNLLENMASGEYDTLENGWDKAVSEMESPTKRSRRADVGENGYIPSGGFGIKAEKGSQFKRGLKGGLKPSQSSDTPDFEQKTQKTIGEMFAKKSDQLKRGPTFNLMRGDNGRRKSTIHEEPESPIGSGKRKLLQSPDRGNFPGHLDTLDNQPGKKNPLRNIFKSKYGSDQQGTNSFFPN